MVCARSTRPFDVLFQGEVHKYKLGQIRAISADILNYRTRKGQRNWSTFNRESGQRVERWRRGRGERRWMRLRYLMLWEEAATPKMMFPSEKLTGTAILLLPVPSHVASRT
jgi:hypothetical protein